MLAFLLLFPRPLRGYEKSLKGVRVRFETSDKHTVCILDGFS